MSWDDGKHTKVKKIQLTFDDVIRSIEVEYEGTTLKSQPRGTVGTKSEGFTLSPDEYITEVNGYYKTVFSGDVITALTFKTNKKTYGTYGIKSRSYFSVNAPNGNQIAGFLGTSGDALSSIDVHFAPIPPAGSTGTTPGGTTGGNPGGTGSNPGGTGANPGGAGANPGGTGTNPGGTGSIPGSTGGIPGGTGANPGSGSNTDSNPEKLEAQGGKEGNQWDDGANHDGVKKIHIVPSGQGIEQIKFDYLNNGETKEGPFHGVKGRGSISTIEINHPNEYLVSVKGWYDSTKIIQGLQFITNTKSSDLVGYEFAGDGIEFSLEVKDKKIIGFHGFADSHLNALGAYFAPITSTPLKPAKKLEAIGGDEGALWDDGVFDGVSKVHVGQYHDGVCFIKIEYNKGSQVIIGDDHGKKSLIVETFKVDYPSEYITALQGYYDYVQGEKGGLTLVTSLIFVTNKQTSNPYGLTSSNFFEIKEEGHKIVGFHGKAGDWVHQIGVYVAPITN